MPRPGWASTRQARKLTTYDVLMGEATLADAIVPTRIPGLSLVPATVDLSGAELELIDMPRRNFILQGRAGGIFRTRSKSLSPMC